MTPRRIQRQRRKGWKMPPNTVYVGRGSKWGNPFFVKKPGLGHENCSIYAVDTLEQVISSYRRYIQRRLQYLDLSGEFTSLEKEARRELAGKHLACWCPSGQTCHADVLLEVANRKY